MRISLIVAMLLVTSSQAQSAPKTQSPPLNDIVNEATMNWKTSPDVMVDIVAQWELKPSDYAMVKELSYILQTKPTDPKHDELYTKWDGELRSLEVTAANNRNQADERLYKVLRQLVVLNRFAPARR
jgi:hypothetical protein